MPNPVCFYHSADLDGQCSGAIVKHKFPDVELMPFNYGNDFPFEKFINRKKQPDVFMVDVSMPIGDMGFLSKVSNLVWIDHHEPIIKEAQAKGFNPAGRRCVGKAACELCWEYLFSELPPVSVHLLGRYDVWDFEGNPDVLPFQWGMRLEDWKPEHNYQAWRTGPLNIGPEAGEFIKNTIGNGKTVLKYEKQQNIKVINTCAFEGWFDGLKALCVNKAMTNSQVFESKYRPEDYKLMVSFYYKKNGKWIVSLYSTHEDVHCGEICKKYGGGGHKGAAGFTADKLPIGLYQGQVRIIES